MSTPTGSPYDEFLAEADRAAAERPDVDRDLARELMLEAATMLDNGLAFDGLDEEDTAAAVAGVAAALVDPDPESAIRARSDDALNDPDLHDPESVSRSYLVAASILRI